MRLESDVVRDHARGQWIGILGRLAPSLEAALARPGHHVPCPVHGGRDGFRVFRDVNQTGGGICNTCGACSDGFALLMWANGWSFREALEAVARDLRLDLGGSWTVLKPRPKARPTHASAGDPTSAKQALHRVWEQTIDPDAQGAEPLRRYLLRRGIEALPDPGVVRFHPALGYFEDRVRKGTYPAMVARVTSAQGGLVSLHRTYLTREGRKAPVECQKKTMTPCGPMQGGAIRLFPAGPELGLTEGIETALAVRQRTGMPVWAALSASLLGRWEPPAGVRLVVIWADLDRSGAGQAAANRLRDRLLAQGIQVALHLPAGPIPAGQKGSDWADLWRLRRRSAA
jgi:phage/plasmid primase-like uncharacterized protein